jgi:predicted nucleic acid-binding protein
VTLTAALQYEFARIAARYFAATALRHDLYLATRDVRDVRMTGAAIFDPWNDDPANFPLSPVPRLGR